MSLYWAGNGEFRENAQKYSMFCIFCINKMYNIENINIHKICCIFEHPCLDIIKHVYIKICKHSVHVHTLQI